MYVKHVWYRLHSSEIDHLHDLGLDSSDTLTTFLRITIIKLSIANMYDYDVSNCIIVDAWQMYLWVEHVWPDSSQLYSMLLW